MSLIHDSHWKCSWLFSQCQLVALNLGDHSLCHLDGQCPDQHRWLQSPSFFQCSLIPACSSCVRGVLQHEKTLFFPLTQLTASPDSCCHRCSRWLLAAHGKRSAASMLAQNMPGHCLERSKLGWLFHATEGQNQRVELCSGRVVQHKVGKGHVPVTDVLAGQEESAGSAGWFIEDWGRFG